jgi:aryl-alcohol dehydrogenase-like predicted oxidoreductase
MAAATFPNILLIPGTSSVAHLRQNLAAGNCNCRLTLWKR